MSDTSKTEEAWGYANMAFESGIEVAEHMCEVATALEGIHSALLSKLKALATEWMEAGRDKCPSSDFSEGEEWGINTCGKVLMQIIQEAQQ